MPDAETSAAKKLVLLDGNSLLYRGFFAMRALTTTAGQPTNAIFSFTMMLLTLLSEQKPDVILVAWDRPEPTFRHKEYAEYKGTRAGTPPELVAQGPLAREMAGAFNIPMVEAPGFEADDVIGTLAKRGRAQGYEVLIVTGDLDALQLVEPGVRVMTTVKGVTDTVIYDEAAVMKRYGLRPDQLTDYRALKGDTSDNIPGVPGVGEKTASQLLQQYGTVENLLFHVDEIKQAKLQSSLVGATQQIAQSKRLATIVRDVPLPDVDLPALDTDPHAPDYNKVRALFEKLEFRTLLRRIPEAGSALTPNPSPNAGRGGTVAVVSPGTDAGGGVDIESLDYDPFASDGDSPLPALGGGGRTPVDYREADTPEALAEMAEAARKSYGVGLRLDLDGEGVLDAKLGGVALSLGDGRVYYVPIAEAPTTPSLGGLFDETAPPLPALGEGAGGVRAGALPEPLGALLEDDTVPKVTHDATTDSAILKRYGVTLRGIVFDTEIAAYLLNAGRRSSFPLNEIAADYAGRELHPLDKKERKGMEPDAIRGHERSESLAGADALLAVRKVQEPRLSAEGLIPVLEKLDLPIAPILAEMELTGIIVDARVLNRISRELQEKISALEEQIFAVAGGEFSIGSTKQLQEVLFEKLKLPANKKTKTGYSTGADALEELATDYPIVSLVLQHRELTKLKSTYTDAMPALVRADTGRIHTSLNQTVAATGRLSSSNPGLQNIPVRTELGREIRRAFVAAPGCVLLSADYSQIELRLFAHVSKDPELVAAFASGEDIHKYTASKIYGVPVAEVTTDMRRAAKTVNYAVIYGISEFALARRLGITMAAAKELKTSYFERFPGVRKYVEDTIAFAREKGYVQTLFGRRRYIPDITSRVFQFRQAAERAAANMPIQGSSADIMKVAMISVHEMLVREKMQAQMLLQVHDELLFEVPPEEVPALASRVHDCMAGAYPLDVALDVEVKTGKTWADVTPLAEPSALAETAVAA